MNKKRVIALLTASVLVLGQAIPINASATGTEVVAESDIVKLTSETERGYNVSVSNAVYLKDGFDGDASFTESGAGTCEIVALDAEKGNVLSISGEKTVTYDIGGTTVKWDGVSVSDAFSGEGTESSPYLIKTGADLKLLSDKVAGGEKYKDVYFKLTNNIDLADYEWEPIGNAGYVFAGIFDGGYNKVSNVKVTQFTNSDDKHFGFFGNVSGTIKNFGVENVTFETHCTLSNHYAGGLVAQFAGTVDNCYARNVSIKNTSDKIGFVYMGGLIGIVNPESTVQGSYAVNVSFISPYLDPNARVSALCGYLKSGNGKMTVKNCYVAGSYVVEGEFQNYYTIAAEEVHRNITSSNNYVAHGVVMKQTAQTNREVNCTVVNAVTMKESASALGEIFVTDVTGLSNNGYPYHKPCRDIPDEAIIAFDVNFSTSTELPFKIVNTIGQICVEDSIENTFGAGWHRVAIDMREGKYYISVDGEAVKDGFEMRKLAHKSVIFTQTAGKTYFIDNLVVEKDFSDEIANYTDALIETVKSGMEFDNVTGNLNLLKNYEGIDITWSVSDERIISTDGTVEKRAVSIPVSVTANYDVKTTASVEKPSAVLNFDVIVAARENVTDFEKVRDIATYYLSDSILSDESLDSITKDLNTLPTEYEGVTIEWVSDKPEVVSNTGEVTLPPVDGDDEEVVLTANISAGDQSASVEFNLKVAAPLSNTAKLKLAADDIDNAKLTDEDINKITKNLTLPKEGLFGSTITWTSDKSAILIDGNIGVVTRGDLDTFVKVTATFELNGETYDKVYSFNVLMSEMASAEQDKSLITGIPTETESGFDIPLTGAKHGSVITWESGDECIVINGDYAYVTRPANTESDKEVVLTVTVTYGEATVTDTFTVKVLKMPADAELIASVVSGITWESISPDAQNEVKNNLSLTTDYGNGIVATWTCEPAGYIDQTGVVIRPAFGTADVDVVLKATVGTDNANVASQEVTFPITIKAFETKDEALRKATSELVFPILSSDPIDGLLNNLYLPSEWRYGTQIEWSSDSERIEVSEADETGYVTRPKMGEENNSVKLTADISLDGISTAKNFYITLAEENGIKEDYNYNYEEFEVGDFPGTSKVTYKKAYLGVFVAQDPQNAENKVLKIVKNNNHSYADKQGMQLNNFGERSGEFDFKTKIYVEKLPDKTFIMNGNTNCGQEIELRFSKNENGVSVNGHVVPMNTWFDYRVRIDTVKKTYKIYVNETFVKEAKFKYITDKPTTDRTFNRFYVDFGFAAPTGEHVVYLDDTMLHKNVYSSDKLGEASTRFETEFMTAQDINNITEDLVIPTVSVTEVTVETKSSNTAVVTDDGVVTRPLTADEVVDFTVKYISKYGSTREKVFKLVVKSSTGDVSADDNSAFISDDITEAYNYIVSNNTTNYITNDISLITIGENGSVISYSSSDTTVITNDGKVTRPTDADKNVTFTITATRNGVSESKTVTLTVKKSQNTPIVIVPGATSGGMSKVPAGGGLTTPPATIVNPTPTEPVKPSEPTAIFSDIGSHWAKDYIEKMYEAGVVNGNDDGTFAPDQTVTREAFITMLVRALDLELVTDNGVFTDVNSNDWFAPFVNTAFQNNIVSGISETEFGITKNISRQDMCVMVYNALKEKLGKADTDNVFADDAEIAEYAKMAVYSLKANGIVDGRDNNTFIPSGTATRAEAAKIICSIKEVAK